MQDTLIETTYTVNGETRHASRALVNAEGERKEAPPAEAAPASAASGGFGGAAPTVAVTPEPGAEPDIVPASATGGFSAPEPEPEPASEPTPPAPAGKKG